MLVTLDLIATNIFNSVEAPPNRNFTYIEIWMLLVYFPIFIAILEYGLILTVKKYFTIKISPAQNTNVKPAFYGSFLMKDGTNFDEFSKKMDMRTFWAILTIIVIGNIMYWIAVFSQI